MEAQNYSFALILSIFCLKSSIFITKRNVFLVKNTIIAPEIQTIVTVMTPNKHFNSYKEGDGLVGAMMRTSQASMPIS